jgi:glycerol-3-phosphate acyltransferase PlsY
MDLFLILAILLFTYFLCAIPFGFLVVRQKQGIDIRTVGSGNIGATNVARAGGRLAGVLTLFLDAAKGGFSVWLAGAGTGQDPRVMAMTAVVALLAHSFPVYLKFKGGKGVATGLGVFLVLAPLAALGSIGIFLVTAAFSRYVSLGSVLAAGSFPVFCYFLVVMGNPGNEGGWWILSAAVITAGLIIGRHHPNLRRLVAGTESKFGGTKK